MQRMLAFQQRYSRKLERNVLPSSPIFPKKSRSSMQHLSVGYFPTVHRDQTSQSQEPVSPINEAQRKQLEGPSIFGHGRLPTHETQSIDEECRARSKRVEPRLLHAL